MGAFHEGHLRLMMEAKRRTNCCVVSLFVNPSQFGPNEDLSRYPRQESTDFELAEKAGADIIFAPSAEEMYPEIFTWIEPGGAAEGWEGERRPGHFRGVATIVAKLFHIVQPNHAYFGRKDLQQCAVIQQMVKDLNMGVELQFVETVRESNGLAMSSRNQYLTLDQRRTASTIYQSISQAAAQMLQPGAEVDSVLNLAADQIQKAGMEVDYLALVDPQTMKQLHELKLNARIIVAVKYQGIRLIDNIGLTEQH